jgi:tungstate transport system ATP-binding protein
MSMSTDASDLPIEFSDVEITTRDARMLDRVTLTIAQGPPTVLIGPNGSGKTTLLRAAMGLVSPSKGRITWAGRADLPPIRRAIVFQRPVMLRRSCSGNLRYALAAAGALRNMRARRVTELLRLVGLEGFDGRPARRLSGGEQQRLALARALARQPDVLFLDEPTASLDPAATKTIEDIVLKVTQQGVKVVMATHDLGEARRLAAHVVLLHRGTVVESASADRFFAAPSTEDGKRFLAGELLL